MIYLTLFYEFFLIGLFAVGGGAATIPFLFDLVNEYHWFSSTDLINMIALSEASPGPIGVNMATFAGIQTAGFFGALSATFGLVLPSLLIIIIILKILDRFSDYQIIHTFLKTIQPVVGALILNATVQIGITSLTNILTGILVIILAVLIRLYPKNPIFYIILSGFVGFFLKL